MSYSIHSTCVCVCMCVCVCVLHVYSLYSDSGVGSVCSSSSRKTSRRQVRASSSASNIQKHPPSPNPSDCSDVSEGQISRRSAPSYASVHQDMSKLSMTSNEMKVAYNRSSPAINDVSESHSYVATATVDGGDLTSPELYEDGTRTWPRKRGSRSNRRRPSAESSQPDSVPATLTSTPVADSSMIPIGLDNSLDLAEISPSKYGCKRDSTVDKRDSPHFAYNPYNPGSVPFHGSDSSVIRAAADDSLSRSSRQSSGGHYASNPYTNSVSSDGHRPHNVSITPLQWDRSQQATSFDDGRAEHILLSQGRRQSSFSATARGQQHVETTPSVDSRTLYEPYRYGVAGVITGDPFCFTPTPRPFAAHASSPAATYSPNLAAGRTSSLAASSSSSIGNRHAVDVLFDNIYKTDDVSSPFGPSTPSVNSGRPTPQPAPQWCEPTIRGQSANTSRRLVLSNCCRWMLVFRVH